MNMEDMIFERMDFGKAALKKLPQVPKNFMLYSAGWVGEFPNCHSMKVSGAEFTEKGKKIKGTERSVYVSKAEIEAEK